VKSRRDREARISAWRKAEAKARAVNEQVVLPGHCASDVVGLERLDHETLAQVPGIGRFRVSRYGDAILAALAEPVTP
jgi:ribonuclease D